MKNNCVFICLLVFSIIIYGQEPKEIKILKNQLQQEKVDTLKIDLYLKIYNSFALKEKDSSLIYFNKALGLASAISYTPRLATKLYKLGANFEKNNNYERAISNFQNAILIFEELQDLKKTASINNFIGYCYINLYAEDKAIEYYLKSLKVYKELNDETGIAMNYTDIGNLYYDHENFDFAKKYYQDALSIL